MKYISAALVLLLAPGSYACEKDGFITSSTLYATVEREIIRNHVCAYTNEDFNSNLGVRLNMYHNGILSIPASYTHHSCVFGEDGWSYNAFGLGVELKFNR